MGKVIYGPWYNRRPGPRYTEDEKNGMMIQALVEELSDSLLAGIGSAGFDNLEEMCYTKDLALIAESIRSYLLKLQDRYHAMQDVAENVFYWKDDGSLQTNESINVEFENFNA